MSTGDPRFPPVGVPWGDLDDAGTDFRADQETVLAHEPHAVALDANATLVSPAREAKESDRDSISVPAVGERIGGIYRVLGRLGQGAMGVILLAEDEQLERQVAIKLLRPEQLGKRAMETRFLSEARALARVHHPNVVEIYSFGEHAGAPYFVMQYVEGTTLDGYARARNGPPLSLDESISIIEQTCRGISAIHESGTAHRDLKPGNILVGAALRVAVADLGLAKKYTKDASAGVTFSGTPAYLAPEVARGIAIERELVPRADIYALGLIAYWLLVGRLPFEERELSKLLFLHAYEPPPAPSSLRPGLSSAFDEPILKALSKDPQERTASAEIFRQEIFAARSQTPFELPGVRLLVADDSDDFRDFVVSVLRVALPGARIDAVADGSSAFAAIKKSPPSLAVFDLDMPGLDGIALTASVRALPNGKDFPIIVATGSGSAADWHRLSRLGASAFLVKPFDPSQLITLARGLLGVSTNRLVPGE